MRKTSASNAPGVVQPAPAPTSTAQDITTMSDSDIEMEPPPGPNVRAEILASYGISSAASSSSSSRIEPRVLQFLSGDGLERVKQDGSVQRATMRPGTAGFAMAKFHGDDCWIETEMPNLALPRSAEPKRIVKKRPAGAHPDIKYRARWYGFNSTAAILRIQGSKKK